MLDDNLNPLAPFLAIASANKVLTKAEERVYIEAAQAGDVNAKTKLVKHNMRLVISIAKRFQNRGLETEELVQEGCLGLLRSVQKFDLSRNLKLSTYATQWIRQFINRAIENKGRLIRVPIHMLSKITHIKRKYREYIEEFQAIPTSETIAALCGITQAESEFLGQHLQDIGSLSESTGEDDSLTVQHYISSDDSGPEADTIVKQDKEELALLLSTLPEEDKNFMVYLYGLHDYKAKTYSEASFAFGLKNSDEAQSREVSILQKLRKKAKRTKFNYE